MSSAATRPAAVAGLWAFSFYFKNLFISRERKRRKLSNAPIKEAEAKETKREMADIVSSFVSASILEHLDVGGDVCVLHDGRSLKIYFPN